MLAILLDQRVRGENIFRTIFLYPMAVSFVVTGTVWSWLLNPGLGIQKLVQDLGWTGFRFDWLVDPDMAIYTLIIAGAWQAAGFAMALFLAGLRSVDCRSDQGGADRWRRHRGASIAGSCCRRMWPIFVTVRGDSAADRHQDLRPRARADRRRPGHRYQHAGRRRLRLHVPAQPLGRGSAAAMLMLLSLLVVCHPYLYNSLAATAERRAHETARLIYAC